MLYHILYVFNQQTHTVAAFYILCNSFDSVIGYTFVCFNSSICFLNGDNYFAAVKINRSAIAFDYFHCPPSFSVQ